MTGDRAACLGRGERPAAAGDEPAAAKRLRIVFAMTTNYLPESTGGLESTTHELCAALAAEGVAPAVMAGCRRGGSFARRAALARLAGRGRLWLDDALGYATYRCRRPCDAVDELCRLAAPDLAVVQLGETVPLARAFVARGVPTIMFFHNLNFAAIGGEPFTHPLLRHATVSEFMAERLEPKLGLRPAVVPPLIDPERYRTTSTRDVATFINPHPVKGLAIALHLARKRPDIPFEFIETWPMRRREVKALAAALADLPNVRFLRRTADMRGVYGRSRLLLVPSQWEEAWGRVVAEAQLSGIPALASKVGGLPEAVGPGGILVAPHDSPEAWERGLAAIWDDAATYERLADAALRHAARSALQPNTLTAQFLALARAHMASAARR